MIPPYQGIFLVFGFGLFFGFGVLATKPTRPKPTWYEWGRLMFGVLKQEEQPDDDRLQNKEIYSVTF